MNFLLAAFGLVALGAAMGALLVRLAVWVATL